MPGILGCGTYEVEIFVRGGHQYVTDLPWNTLDWTRVLDDTSTARVSATVGLGDDCRGALGTVRPWRHEVALYRDGELAWSGPITSIRSDGEQYQLEARDLSAWWDHRLIHNDHLYTNVDIATVFQAISDDAMAPDPSPGLTINARPTGIIASQSVNASQHQYAGTVLRDLARAGIDWTAYKREVIVGGRIIPAAPLAVLGDEAFVKAPVILDGLQQANQVIVSGSGTGAQGGAVFATAPKKSAIAADGLLESAQLLATLQDFNAAKAAAESRVEIASEIFAIQNAQFQPDAPVAMDDLVPGALAPFALEQTTPTVEGIFRLQGIAVNAAAENGVEAVTASFQPQGTT